jgi:hypothetical protein
MDQARSRLQQPPTLGSPLTRAACFDSEEINAGGPLICVNAVPTAFSYPGSKSERKAMTDWWHQHRGCERAYAIWERASRPQGGSVKHRLQAEADIASDEDGPEPKAAQERESVV